MSEPTDRREAAGAPRLPIAAEYERLLALELERRRRRDSLEALLPTIADALDVRVVFPRLSDVIQEVIPHVTVALALLTPDGLGVKIHVASNYDVGDLPVYRFTNDSETIRSNWRAFVGYDCTVLEEGVCRVQTSRPGEEPPVYAELRPGPPWTRMLTALGVRSMLRVPVRIKDQAVGAISFGSDQPFAYGDDDIVLATRIADHVALALAHERLAEEGRRAAQEQERANLLEERVQTLVQELESRGSHRALGESPRWKDALTHATKVAGTETTVLVTGESGTGKEVVARYIHRGSPRARGPFIALNCAALPEQLLESELFGYERGAFTGAHASRPGKIEQAAGGVLFLDEVGEMSLPVQAKFLRVLQEREFQRLGGSRTIKADVRVIAATNRDPRAGDGARHASRRPVLSPQRLRDRAAAAARAARRHPAARERLSAGRRDERRQACGRHLGGCAGAAAPACMAGERPRAEERDRARGDPLRGRADQQPASADRAGGAGRNN